jgi:CheY-like chemotaxis protein
MPDGGKLSVETANRHVDERAALLMNIQAGQYVSMCVSDNGVGMPPEVAARAFDPFFTTKPTGLGTGLGLSMIYGFAKQSGGHARIYSEVGQGTMVCIYLPRCVEDCADSVQAGAVRVPEVKGVGCIVLVVDDEASVRMFVSEILLDLGCTVLEAGDGIEALQILQSTDRLDLLVSDVGLPGGMNGRQVADAARSLKPELPILFITGYAENAVLSHGHLDPGMHVMTKPFEMRAFMERVERLLSDPDA